MTTEATKYVYDLFKQHGEAVADLEVRRASLEDTYMTLVQRAETGGETELGLQEAGAR
jgi:ABC-2 type transport system ATP-binding protein